MKKLTLILTISMLSGISVFAQRPGRAYTEIYVRDKENNRALIGANITISCGQDTIRGTASKFGNEFIMFARFQCDRVFKDSVDLQVSYLGYQLFEKRYSPRQFEGSVSLYMEEDPFMINQIVVNGDRIAMVIKGDTTIYDAAAFKTMEGDRFSELLKQLPGIEIRNNKIYAGDEQVKRVYIDGRNLFGSHTSFTLTDIEADDVKNVEVYEEDNPDAVRIGDTTAPKDKVMNVITHSKRDVIKGGDISLSGGASLEKDYSGRHEIRHTEDLGFYRNAETGSGRLSFSNSKNDGDKDAVSIKSKITPSEQTYVNAMYEYRRGDSTTVMTDVNFTRNNNKKIQGTIMEYFPTEEYSRRVIETLSNANSRDVRLDASNITILQRKKNIFSFALGFGAGNDESNNNSETIQSIDNETTRTERNDRSKMHNMDFNGVLSYSGALSEKTTLAAEVIGTYSKNTGNTWNLDTLASDPGLRVFLNNDADGNNKAADANVSIQRQLNETSSFSLSYSYSYRYDKSRQLSIDLLDNPEGIIDNVNSYDYTVNSRQNMIDAGWIYRSKSAFCSVKLQGSIYEVRNDESLPREETLSHTFYLFNPSVSFFRFNPHNRISGNISSRTTPLSVEMLRNSIDVSNPMFVVAGNPDLKPPNNINFDFNYSLTKAEKSRTLAFGISGHYTFNHIAIKRILYTNETYVPEYDYTFQKGAELTSRNNVDNAYNIGGSFRYSQRINSIRSTLHTSVNYNFQQTPYYVGESLRDAMIQEARVAVGINTGFSTKLKIDLTSSTALGYHKVQTGESRYIRETVSGSVDVRFAKKYFVFVKGIYELYANDRSSVKTQNNLFANMSLGRKFGKENQAAFSMGVVDIFNRTSVASTRLMNDYLYTSTTSYLGRYGYLMFSYTF